MEHTAAQQLYTPSSGGYPDDLGPLAALSLMDGAGVLGLWVWVVEVVFEGDLALWCWFWDFGVWVREVSGDIVAVMEKWR